jgi:hypothetical protein
MKRETFRVGWAIGILAGLILTTLQSCACSMATTRPGERKACDDCIAQCAGENSNNWTCEQNCQSVCSVP